MYSQIISVTPSLMVPLVDCSAQLVSLSESLFKASMKALQCLSWVALSLLYSFMWNFICSRLFTISCMVVYWASNLLSTYLAAAMKEFSVW